VSNGAGDIVTSSMSGRARMAQFVVRNLEDDVADKLKQRAKPHSASASCLRGDVEADCSEHSIRS
jgi:hypothetical protein